MQLHEKIKMLRKKKNMPQQELADLVGIHITHLSRLENGHFQPSLDIIKKLIDIFKVDANFLLKDDITDYEVKIKDKSLAERVQLVDTLEEADQKALIQVIDTMLTKKRILDLVTKKQEMLISM